MTTDIAFNHTGHVRVWNEIVQILSEGYLLDKLTSPGSIKMEAFERLYIPEGYIPVGGCYACEYVDDIEQEIKENEDPKVCLECKKSCPLLWPDNLVCDDDESIYTNFTRFLHCGYHLSALKCAEQIRDLPVREGVKTV